MSEQDVSQVLAGLKSKDEGARLYAVQDLCALDPEGAAEYLLPCLQQEESQAVREAIVLELQHLDCSKVYDQLFSFFSSPDPFLRNSALLIFGAGGQEAVGYLASKLDHANKEVRKLVLDALMENGSPEAILAIRAALHDPAPNVQITAVEYLGRLQDRQSLPEILELFVKEDEPMLRVTILEALYFIEDEQAIGRLLSLLSTDALDPLYIPQLLKLAGKMGREEDILDFLTKIDNPECYLEDILLALELARRRLPSLHARKQCAEFLLQLLCKSDLPEHLCFKLVEFLALSPDEEIRSKVKQCLQNLSRPELEAFYQEIVQDEG